MKASQLHALLMMRDRLREWTIAAQEQARSSYIVRDHVRGTIREHGWAIQAERDARVARLRYLEWSAVDALTRAVLEVDEIETPIVVVVRRLRGAQAYAVERDRATIDTAIQYLEAARIALIGE